MALHSKWTSGDLLFYDGTQEIMRIKNSTGGVIFGEEGVGVDVKYHGATTGAYMLWDESANSLVFAGGAQVDWNGANLTIEDADYLIFGDSTDFRISWAATGNLDVEVIVPHTEIVWGSTNYPITQTFWGTTASGAYMRWESSGSDLDFHAADITMQDSSYVKFGYDNDFTIGCSTGNVLNFVGTSAHALVNIGSTGQPLTVAFHGSTDSGAYMQWESSGSNLVFQLADISMGDGDLIKLGDSDDFSLSWTTGAESVVYVAAEAVATKVNWGTSGAAIGHRFWGTSDGAGYMEWSSSGKELIFDGADIAMRDSSYIYLGYDNDFVLGCSTDNILSLTGTSANAAVEIGSANQPLTVTFHGSTESGDYMRWDSSGSILAFNEADITMNDDNYIYFGYDNDFAMTCSTDNVLSLVGTTSNMDLELGSATYPLDVVMSGNITYRGAEDHSSTGTLTLGSTSSRVQFISGASCDGLNVLLPGSTTSAAGMEFKLFNNSSSGFENRIFDGTTATLLVTTIKNEHVLAVNDGSEWLYILGVTG